MGYELTGKLIVKSDTVQKSESFKTRDFVVEKTEDVNGRVISNYVKFQSVQERTNLLDRFNIGDEVKVHFNIRGTKWDKDGKTSYFTNLDAWRIEQILQPGKGTQSETDHPEPMDTFSSTSQEAIDDLPF